ncbi:MAG: hypothetical protein A2X56_06420 [Nitrospirae bacterium GWC2_57_13]|jgi:cell division septum initiation protein DivIVA|nr:MAG: hypothetical protein A2072_07560 [Nitrospirae bacterium GWC1_57_7]OGW29720.1 MAG: hypothetical protein A2X56_06420 [Nitrospirae bacterium GWC2_57_13]OGW45526.1 MAG: hypothetical protein A2X57_09385 [Nitrospirae bacterium GWD2_57_8]HAS54919.1 hypothetical protein [Nitrospiraceae bacterium]
MKPEKDLAASLGELEERVAKIVAENRRQKKRIRELEQELASLQREALSLQHVQGLRMRLREKVEKILKTLDAQS